MRENSLDEFESLFERASIPVFDVPELEISSIAGVLTGDALDETILRIAVLLKERFGPEVALFMAGDALAEHVAKSASQNGISILDSNIDSAADLVSHLQNRECDLILLPIQNAEDDAVTVDGLVHQINVPILIVRKPNEDPHTIFRNVLHALNGSLEKIEHIAYSFALVADNGLLKLLHTIDESELDDVRETLKVTPDISSKSGENLIEDFTTAARRQLKGIVEATRNEPYEVAYELRVGEVQTTVQAELAAQTYGLLVVGRHEAGRSLIDAEEYQLMHVVKDIPVLAL